MGFKMKRNKGNFPFKKSPLKLLTNPYQVDIDEQLEHAAANAARDYKGVFDRHRLGHNLTGGNFDDMPSYVAPNQHKVQQANRALEHRMSIIADRMNKRSDWTSGKAGKLAQLERNKDSDPDWISGKYSAEEWRDIQKRKLGMKTKSEVTSMSNFAIDEIKKGTKKLTYKYQKDSDKIEKKKKKIKEKDRNWVYAGGKWSLRKKSPLSKKTRCWKGYEPTPGKKPYSKGSCKKK
tara:strand:- start:3130 stop:3831 length:702 start_codon:yes stop_codon:yes gene_type:complete